MWSLIALAMLVLVHGKEKKKQYKSDPNDFRGNTPFLLQDPYDKTCLGPTGFTTCDERALWIVTKRPGKKTYSFISFLTPSPHGMCLERKKGFLGLFPSDKIGMGSCSKDGANRWEFEFVDKDYIRMSTQGQCVVRGKKGYKSTASLQSCKKGEYLPLLYHPTTFHEMGFFLKGADEKCFDGTEFRACDNRDSGKLLWGVGVKYTWGQAVRYFFNFPLAERENCIVAKGSRVERGSCASPNALKWGLENGKLTFKNGKMCLVRHVDDSAGLAKCSEANEHMSMVAPEVLKLEDIEKALKDPNITAEQRKALHTLLQQYSGQA